MIQTLESNRDKFLIHKIKKFWTCSICIKSEMKMILKMIQDDFKTSLLAVSQSEYFMIPVIFILQQLMSTKWSNTC